MKVNYENLPLLFFRFFWGLPEARNIMKLQINQSMHRR